MKSFTLIPKAGHLLLLAALVWGLGLTDPAAGQDKRNPVLEFCTGTWCQWCPCGDSTAIKSILPQMPNAIILAYHGPANSASDPFSFFPGNTIISSLNLTGYPTGVIDRMSGIIVWNNWIAPMNARASVPATVRINLVSAKFDTITRQFTGSFNFTALQTLSGVFRYNVILVEDDIVFRQTSNNTCTPGVTSISNYVHDWLVRDMMNGALGDTLSNGTWSRNQVIAKSITHTVPLPPANVPKIVPRHCRFVVKVYKVGSPLNTNGEIQQAEQWPLLLTSVKDDRKSEIVDGFALSPNYPNPLRLSAATPETRISYVLPNGAGKQNVSLIIYNQLGQRVRTLVNDAQNAGSHDVLWDGRDDQGQPVVGGIYFYRLRFGAQQATRKIVVLR